MPAPRALQNLIFAGASVLFFVSGGTGLAYQVIWSKRFSHVWGNSTLAIAAVVASFLFGLGLGANLLGRIADRLRSGLLAYGVAEFAIGLLALLIPFEIHVLRAASSSLYPLLVEHPVLHALARFLLTFVVIGPACVLMGGTLPLLIRYFTPPTGTAGAATGWLYGINTLGAAGGAFFAGFYLLPTLGLSATNFGVAAVNLGIGVLAFVANALAHEPQRPSSSADVEPSRPQDSVRAPPATATASSARAWRPATCHPAALYSAVALTGCASLILEMVWTRQLAVILGGSTYAFSAMLFLLLAGIGLGSWLFHAFLREREDLSLVPALTIVGVAVATCAGRLLVPHVTLLVGAVRDLRSSEGWNAAVSVGASAVLELVPAIGMGILFPVFIDATRRQAAETGRAIGVVYAWNTAGSIAGAAATFIFLVPRLGLAGSTALALGLYLLALLATFPYSARVGGRAAILAASCIVVTLAAAVSGKQGRSGDPLATDMGYFLYGAIESPEERYENLFFEEGASCNVFVTRSLTGAKSISLHVNGKVDASTGHDMQMQLGLTYFPMLLHPTARDICVIGFGSGTSSGAALLFPQTRVTCCEIEPAVFRASYLFAGVNHSPEKDPRFRLVIDDGRSHVQGVGTRYDLILSEPSNPWLAGVSNLFTREFYEAARDRLQPGGILAQWLQVYSFSTTDYALISRTVLQVFPECGFIRISSGDTILLASMTPLGASKETIDAAQALVDATPLVREDLRVYFESTDVRSILLSHYLLDTAGVARFVADDALLSGKAIINTDLNMKLEFDAPRRIFERGNSSDVTLREVLAHADPAWFGKAASQWGCGKQHAAALHGLTKIFDKKAQLPILKGIVEAGLTLDPDSPELIVDKAVVDGAPDPAGFAASVERLWSLSKKELNRLGVTMFKSKKLDRSIAVFERVIRTNPDSATAWNNLAVAYEAAGKLELAKQALDRALAVDPVNEQVRGTFERFQQKHEGQAEPGAAGSDITPTDADASGAEPATPE